MNAPAMEDNVNEAMVLEDAARYAVECGGNEQLFRQAAQDFLAGEPETSTEGVSTTMFSDHTPMFYMAMVVLALGATIQGADETVINGAQTFFIPQFGMEGMDAWIGLVNGAPYLCCAALGCWLTIPVNAYLGRRNSIILASVIQMLSCIAQACVPNWKGMFATRIILGLGIGINSATVPMFAAEVAPAHIRGAIGMLWQFFTAAGIMLGNAVSLALYRVSDHGIPGLNWRLMMGFPAIIAVIIICLAPFCPESPRYLLGKGNHKGAFKAMCRFRRSEAQASRDLFQAYYQEKERASDQPSKGKWLTMWATIKSLGAARNRRALYASQLVMFMQQFCGVNVIAYYSTWILEKAGYSEITALGCSLGLGAANFLFAIPAFFIIDRFGRRPLLLFTLPVMAIFLAMTGGAFYAEGMIKNAIVMSGLTLFMVTYSPGAGPVPFPYCAEVHATEVRPYGMSINTATTWMFNFIISLTFPSLKTRLGEAGVFFYYSGWNLVLFFAVYFIIREVRGLRLEEVDNVFRLTTLQFAAWQSRRLWCRLTGQEVPKQPMSGIDSSDEGNQRESKDPRRSSEMTEDTTGVKEKSIGSAKIISAT